MLKNEDRFQVDSKRLRQHIRSQLPLGELVLTDAYFDQLSFDYVTNMAEFVDKSQRLVELLERDQETIQVAKIDNINIDDDLVDFAAFFANKSLGSERFLNMTALGNVVSHDKEWKDLGIVSV